MSIKLQNINLKPTKNENSAAEKIAFLLKMS